MLGIITQRKLDLFIARMDELTRVIEEEVIAEQYNAGEQGIMQSMTMTQDAADKKLIEEQMGDALTEGKNNLEKEVEVSGFAERESNSGFSWLCIVAETKILYLSDTGSLLEYKEWSFI